MKKTFIALLVNALLLNTPKLFAQCAITDIVTNIRQSVPDPNNSGNCLVTFDMQFNIDANNGFKITILQAWPEQDYPGFWKNSCMPSNNAPRKIDLQKNSIGPLPFINLAYESNGNVFTPLSSYVDASVPLNTGYTVTAGQPLLGFIPVKISNITVSLPGGCRGVTIRADIWGTQGSPTSQWKPHCVSCNNAHAFNYPRVQGIQECQLIDNTVQRAYRLSVNNSNTDQAVTINGFSVYRDDNNSGSLELTSDVRVGFDQKQRVLLPNQGFSTDPVTYAGNSGTTRDQKLFIVLDIEGVMNDVFTECAQVSCGNLPVRLKSFQVQQKNGRTKLYWQTASEQDNKGFEVQRRTENADFEAVRFVTTKAMNGNSNVLLQYEYEDLMLPKAGVVYYRLKQIDLDGKASFSDTRSVQHAFSAAVKVFPNPSRGNITIQVPAVIGKYDLVLSDQYGNRLRQWLNESRSVFGINNLKQGIYLVTVHSHALASRFTQRIIVQ